MNNELTNQTTKIPAGGYPDDDFERGFRAGARDRINDREFDGEIASDPHAPYTVGYCSGWDHGEAVVNKAYRFASDLKTR